MVAWGSWYEEGEHPRGIGGRWSNKGGGQTLYRRFDGSDEKILARAAKAFAGGKVNQNIQVFRGVAPEFATKLAAMKPGSKLMRSEAIPTTLRRPPISSMQIMLPKGTRADLIGQKELEVSLPANTTLLFTGTDKATGSYMFRAVPGTAKPRLTVVKGKDPEQLTRDAVLLEAKDYEEESRNVAEIAKDLNARTGRILKKQIGRPSITKSAPDTDELISDVIASELNSGLQSHPGMETWYSNSINETMDIVAKMHPEIRGDKDQKFAFLAALAVTSQGSNVNGAATQAERAYDEFKRTGKFPETGFRSKGNFRKLNALIKAHGVSATRELFDTQFTARELEKATGVTPGKRRKGDMVWGSAILGPKIGNFYQNMAGNFDPITMDRWFMRAWGRITNTGIGKPDLEPGKLRVRNALKADGQPVPRTDLKLMQRAREIQKQHEADYKDHHDEYESGERDKSELVLACERLVHNSDNGMVEEPKSAEHIAWIDGVFRKAIAKTGKNLTPAAAQAVWWAPEQEMYRKLGSRPEVGNDYAKAFRKLALERGIDVDGKRAA